VCVYVKIWEGRRTQGTIWQVGFTVSIFKSLSSLLSSSRHFLMLCFLFRNFLDFFKLHSYYTCLAPTNLVMTVFSGLLVLIGLMQFSYCKSTDLTQFLPTCAFMCKDFANFFWFSLLLLRYLVTCNNSFCQFTESLACILPTQLTLSSFDTFLIYSVPAENIPSTLDSSTAHRNLPRPVQGVQKLNVSLG